MIGRIDARNKPEELSELGRQPVPPVKLAERDGDRYLAVLEEQVTAVGWALIRQRLVEPWRLTDRALVEADQARHPDIRVTADGDEELKVVSRFPYSVSRGRRLSYHPGCCAHSMFLYYVPTMVEGRPSLQD